MLPSDLSTLASLCGAVWNGGTGGALLVAMFVAGLTASVTHCALMCGPLVLAQVGALPAASCARARLIAGARFPYHFGRVSTYMALGVVAGLGGRTLMRWASAGAAVAALLLIAAASVMAWLAFRPHRPGGAGHLSRWIARRAKPFFGSGWWNGVRLGVVLGLLPCGMIYAALSVAASTASPLAGGLSMLAFGLGTMPSLVSIGTIGRALGVRFPAKWAGAPMAVNAALLALLAWRAWMAA